MILVFFFTRKRKKVHPIEHIDLVGETCFFNQYTNFNGQTSYLGCWNRRVVRIAANHFGVDSNLDGKHVSFFLDISGTRSPMKSTGTDLGSSE